MNHDFDIDDPLLTAYALGELDDAQRQAVEQAIDNSPELQSAIAEIRNTATRLQQELAAEIASAAPLPMFEPLVVSQAVIPSNPSISRRFPVIFSFFRSKAIAASLLLLVTTGAIVTWSMKNQPRAREYSRLAEADSRARDLSKKDFGVLRDQLESLGYVGDEAESEQLGRPAKEAKASKPQGGGGRGKRREAAGSADQSQQQQLGGSGYTADRDELKGLGYNAPSAQATQKKRSRVNNSDPNLIRDLISKLAPYSGDEKLTEGLSSPAFRHRSSESYDTIIENAFLSVMAEPLSTFSIDVDTASYANVRRMIHGGQRPPRGAVRIEELVNYFSYDYAPPSGDEPFAFHLESADCPWQPDHRLVRVGIKGFEVPAGDHPMGNFVFLVDTSGSMQEPNKLPLVQQSLKLLVENLPGDDRVAIVVYAGSAGLVLDSTAVRRRGAIMSAIDGLEAGGSTNGGEGIQLAYDVAADNFIKGGTNRVILCTDGDFNVGITDQGALVNLITRRAKEGVFLSVMGFGMGNLKDDTMEKLADKGNGNYGYIDSIDEARKLFVEQLTSTLVTIAKDVKIQVEFNPAQAKAYRLIGYENRRLANQDFNDDTKDAGEIGAGHTVTALYEVVPARIETDPPPIDPLKYQPVTEGEAESDDESNNNSPLGHTCYVGEDGNTKSAERTRPSDELLTLKLRYKAPDGDTSELIEVPFTDDGNSWSEASPDFQFAASVAAFGMVLRDSQYCGGTTLSEVADWTDRALSNADDRDEYRTEFRELIDKAALVVNSSSNP